MERKTRWQDLWKKAMYWYYTLKNGTTSHFSSEQTVLQLVEVTDSTSCVHFWTLQNQV